MIKELVANGLDISIANESILDSIRSLEMAKIFIDNGVKPSTSTLYGNKFLREYLGIKSYQSHRPATDLSFITNSCMNGLYLPVYRIDTLYYDEEDEESTERIIYCGTFYLSKTPTEPRK